MLSACAQTLLSDWTINQPKIKDSTAWWRQPNWIVKIGIYFLESQLKSLQPRAHDFTVLATKCRALLFPLDVETPPLKTRLDSYWPILRKSVGRKLLIGWFGIHDVTVAGLRALDSGCIFITEDFSPRRGLNSGPSRSFFRVLTSFCTFLSLALQFFTVCVPFLKETGSRV